MSFSSFFDYPDAAERERAEDLVFLPAQSEGDWTKLLGFTEMRRFAAGDIVVREGETDRALYIVSGGTLELLIPGAGRRGLRRLSTFEAGAVIGEMSFFDGQPRSATIRAVTDSDLFRLSYTSFDVMAAREPALARAVLFDLGRILALRVRYSNAFISG